MQLSSVHEVYSMPKLDTSFHLQSCSSSPCTHVLSESVGILDTVIIHSLTSLLYRQLVMQQRLTSNFRNFAENVWNRTTIMRSHVVWVLLWSSIPVIFVFTALHGMQRGLNDEISVCLSVRLSVRPSVCLSVKRVHCDKTEEKSVRIFIPCERPLCLLLW